MTSKTLQFKKGLITTNLKRFWWMSALYALLLFFSMPFRHIMLGPDIQDTWTMRVLEEGLRFFSHYNNFQSFLIVVLPVALAVLLYKYLMASKSAAMIHSLPYTRKTLYINHFIAGCILLMIPVLLTALILMLFNATTFLGAYYSLAGILEWVGLTLLFNLLMFSIAVFVGMFTGNSIAHIAFNYILHFLPIALYSLINDSLQQWLYGYGSSVAFNAFTERLPLFLLLENYYGNQKAFTAGHALVYLMIALLFFIAAGYFYEKRRLEAATDVIAFSWVQPIFKYGVTFCGMLLGGLYFRSISNYSIPITLFGYFLSSLFSYWVAEVLIQKSIRVFHTYKGYLLYASLITLILVGIHMDFFGYVTHVPEPQQIEKAYIGYYSDMGSYEKNKQDSKYRMEGSALFEEPQNIMHVMDLHYKLVENPDRHQKGPRYYIGYMLKNGKYFVRQYTIEDKKYVDYLKPIYDSEEYKEALYPILHQNVEEVKSLQFRDWRSAKKPLVLANKGEMEEFLSFFQQDVDHSTFKGWNNRFLSTAQIEVFYADGPSQYYDLPEDFQAALQWLKDRGYYQSFALLLEDIEYVTLKKDISSASEGPSESIEIRDPKVIEELFAIDKKPQDGTGNDYIYVDYYIAGQSGRHSYQNVLFSSTPVSDSLKAYMDKLKKD
ncbi:MAG: DUF6449 domain-containing protein [Thermotaleaceae bacterium]